MAKTYSIKAIFEVLDKASAPLVKVSSSLDRIGARLDKLSASSMKLNQRFQGIGKTFESTGKDLTTRLTLPLLGLGGAALKVAGDFEMLEAEFTTMLKGNREEAKKLTNQIKQFGEVTPFQVMDLARNAKLMLNFGVSADKVLPNLRMLGDVAGGNAEKLNSLTLAFSQVQSQGKLTGQDLLQMINAGFNPLKVVAGDNIELYKRLRKQMSEGAFTAEMVADAFKKATSDGGLFYKNMERQSKTIPGLISTMRDGIVNFLATLGRMVKESLMLDKVIPMITAKINEFTKRIKVFGEENPELFRFLLILGLILGALGPLLLALGAFVTIAGKVFAVVAVGLKTLKILLVGFSLISKSLLVIIKITKVLFALFATNPILLAIMAIATAVLLIIRYWQPIKAFFIRIFNAILEGAKIFSKFLYNIFIQPYVKVYNFFKKYLAKIFDRFSSGKDLNINIRDRRQVQSQNAFNPDAIRNASGTGGGSSEVVVKVSADQGSTAAIDKVKTGGKHKVRVNNSSGLGAIYVPGE